MITRALMISVATAALAGTATAAGAQEVLKLGLVQSMTGASTPAGKAVVNGALLYLKQHGDVVAGRKISGHRQGRCVGSRIPRSELPRN